MTHDKGSTKGREKPGNAGRGRKEHPPRKGGGEKKKYSKIKMTTGYGVHKGWSVAHDVNAEET